MNNEIDEIIKGFNITLSNMEAGLVLVEYATKNDMPISPLAKITIQEACEELQENAKLLLDIIGE